MTSRRCTSTYMRVHSIAVHIHKNSYAYYNPIHILCNKNKEKCIMLDNKSEGSNVIIVISTEYRAK